MPSLRQVSRADLFAVFKTEAMVRFIEGLISSVESSDTSAIQAALDAHIADITDAHQASAIGATPGGSRAANNVQGQLGELDTNKLAASLVSTFILTLLDDADAAAARATLGLGTLATQSGTFSGTSSGTNTGDQTIALTGDATGSGTGSFAVNVAKVNGVSFAGLATGLLKNTTGTGAPSIAAAGTDYVAPGGALGTPSSGTLTNCTGLPIATGVSGLAANVAAFLATPSSANMAAMITDETGTGSNVFATNPTITNPIVSGTAYIQQGAQTSKAAAATLTIAELLTGIIQYTGAAANLTLPTGTNIDAGVVASLPVDRAFDFIVINTGSGVATVVTNTGLTTVGTLTVATATSARFRVRKTAANTFTVYRIG